MNLEKLSLLPSQVVSYLGVRVNSQTFRALPTPSRIEKFVLKVEEFLSKRRQSARFWRVLMGHLASLIHLVPGGRLRVRSVQLALRSRWDFKDKGRLEEGVSLESHSPELMFWSDLSDQDWGANMEDQVASGLWSEEEKFLSINVRELLAVERGLLFFLPLRGHSVAVFCDNTTALSYLRHQGGTLSPRLNSIAQRILRWAEVREVLLFPQFVMGRAKSSRILFLDRTRSSIRNGPYIRKFSIFFASSGQ